MIRPINCLYCNREIPTNMTCNCPESALTTYTWGPTGGRDISDDILSQPKPNDMQTGWICPRCMTVHAPWVSGCYCPRPTVTTTGTGTGG